MHRQYFPACPIDGPIDPPIPFGHMTWLGAVPNKCGSCASLFEGSCLRFAKVGQRYMYLDHGPCGIDGPTDPVSYEDEFVHSKVEVPRKCSSCRFLSHDRIQGFGCDKDSDIWGDFRRGLDWGAWSPDRLWVELPRPKVTTKRLIDCLHDEDPTGFIAEHRRCNSGVSMIEARKDYSDLMERLNAAEDR